MKRISTFFHRRSLTLAAISLLFAFVSFGEVPAISPQIQPLSPSTFYRALALCLCTAWICAFGFLNLVRDVDRQYPPSRCSLAAVLLLPSGFAAVWLGYCLVGYIARSL